MKSTFHVCYLCGNNLDGHTDFDHVPPKQFYSKSSRQQNDLNLLKLPVHRICHKPFQKDEDYFIHTVGPEAYDTVSGQELWKDISKQLRRPESIGLSKKVLSEFDERPGGLYLPNNKIVKRFDGKRIWGIVWKIIRGLYFFEKKIYLPKDTPHKFISITSNEEPPEIFKYVRYTPSRGRHPKIFDYKYFEYEKKDECHISLWGILLWEKIIMLTGFVPPDQALQYEGK